MYLSIYLLSVCLSSHIIFLLFSNSSSCLVIHLVLLNQILKISVCTFYMLLFIILVAVSIYLSIICLSVCLSTPFNIFVKFIVSSILFRLCKCALKTSQYTFFMILVISLVAGYIYFSVFHFTFVSFLCYIFTFFCHPSCSRYLRA